MLPCEPTGEYSRPGRLDGDNADSGFALLQHFTDPSYGLPEGPGKIASAYIRAVKPSIKDVTINVSGVPVPKLA